MVLFLEWIYSVIGAKTRLKYLCLRRNTCLIIGLEGKKKWDSGEKVGDSWVEKVGQN